jgi:hypothetical protein
MRRRGPFCFYAFDLPWLDGKDLRDRPLLERKRLLRKLMPRRTQSVLYVEHVESGSDLFRVICERDMEGVVAKQANGRYTPEATTCRNSDDAVFREHLLIVAILRTPIYFQRGPSLVGARSRSFDSRSQILGLRDYWES